MVITVNYQLICLVCGKKVDFLNGGSCEACRIIDLLHDPVELYWLLN
jgi:hypothetical protein